MTYECTHTHTHTQHTCLSSSSSSNRMRSGGGRISYNIIWINVYIFHGKCVLNEYIITAGWTRTANLLLFVK